MVTIDKTGKITSSNNGARLLFGYPMGKMLGMRVELLMPHSFRAGHQAYIDRYVESRVSSGAIGAWKVRPAVRSDGEQFDIRIALSVSTSMGQPVISSLIDPLYEAIIRTDGKGKIVEVSGSPWLLFGYTRDALKGQQIDMVLRHSTDWFSSGDRVVMCKNLVGDEFTALLKMKKEKDSYVGHFGQAPALRVTVTVLESGIILACSGESKALLGHKPKALRGQPITFLLPEEELAAVTLDKKAVVQMHHRNGRTVFVTVRVAKVKDASGKTLYEAVLKGKKGKEFKGLALKGQKLRYGGQVLGWYELGPSLGHGMCGPVKRAVHRLTGEEVAIKTLARDRYRELGMQWPPLKIDILDRVKHPNLVRMFDVISTPEEVLVIMELIDGGEMFDFCERSGALPENQARVMWRQLLSGVDYLHRGGVCHRDIKLDNLVLDCKHNLKLIDFGFATSFTDSEDLTLFCGSPDYAAPELVASVKYKGPAVDIWAMGVVLYVMVTGYVPFSSPDRIRTLRWDWPPGSTPSVSLQKLLSSIFQPSEKRATMDQLLSEAWANEGFSEPIALPDPGPLGQEQLQADILDEMQEHYGWSRDEVIAALNEHASNQITMTYHLLEYKKEKALVQKNPIWKRDLQKMAKSKQKCSVM